MGGGGGRGRAGKKFPMHKINGRAFYCSYLAWLQYWIKRREQERCHHCFCSLSFDEKQKVSLPFLPATCHHRLRSPLVSEGAALPPLGQKRPREDACGGQCGLVAWRHEASRTGEPGKEQPGPHTSSGLAQAHGTAAGAQAGRDSVTSPFYPGSSLSLKEAGTRPALVR